MKNKPFDSNRIWMISVFLILLPLLAFPREKIALAVLDFDAKNTDQANAEFVTDLLQTELFNTGSFKVVERQKVKKLIEEQHFQSSGMTDMDQAVEIGRLLNVQKIMIGTVTLLGSTYIINTRILDVQSAAVVLAEATECRGGEEELPNAIAQLATTISYKVGLEGSVIRVSANEIFMDLGNVDGVKLGQKFDVIRSGEVITDLEGRVIGATQEIIGTVLVSKIQDRFSVASVEGKKLEFRKGDLVRPSTEDEEYEVPEEPVKKKSSKKEENKGKADVPPIF